MSFRLKNAIETEYDLIRSDDFFDNEGDATKIKIRLADTHAETEREQLFSKITREISKNSNTINLVTVVNNAHLQMVEARLTLSACNILNSEGEPAIKFKDGVVENEEEFAEVWGALPLIVTREISEYVREVNTHWRPGGED